MPTTPDPVTVPAPAPPNSVTAATEARLARDRGRSYRLGVVNGALYQGGEGFIDGGTVIPVFLSHLTSSNTLIGLSAAMGDAGWLLPQFLVAPYMARQPLQMWLYHRAAVVRGLGLGVIAALAIPLSHGHPGLLLLTFFLGYGAYCLGAGFGAVPFMEVVGKTIPTARLGSYWASRLFWGGSFAAAAGLIVRQVLEWPDDGVKFALLFAVATVVVSTGYAVFGTIPEPPGVPDPHTTSPWSLLREGLRLLRHDRPFRQVLLGRAMLNVWLTASPFVVLFAVRDLHAGGRAAGTFLFARVAGFVLSNVLWRRLSATRGNPTVLRISVIGAGASALLAAGIAAASPWGLGWLPGTAAVIALEGTMALGGAAHSGILVAYSSLLVALAPEGRRQAFVSIMMTFLGVTMALPMLGGALVDMVDAPLLFALCGVVALLGARALAGLPESRGGASAALAGCGDAMSAGGGQ